MKNRKGRRAPSCEHVEPPREAASDRDIGLLGCGRCRNSLNAIVEESRGFTRVVALVCLGCEVTLPVGDGFVVWPAASRVAP